MNLLKNVTALTAIVSGIDPSCNSLSDGSASATASGGIMPYSYSWDNGQTLATATGLLAGTYTVTVTDAGGTTVTNSITITDPAAISVDAGTDQTVCSGTAVTLTASGASTYSWDNNVTDGTAFTPSATTTYSVTGSDANGCTATDAVNVTVNALPTVDAGTDQTVCAGTAVTLTASGSSSGSTNTQTFTSANSNYSIDGEANVTGMTFNNDGTKMFLVGTQGNDITEYALSTAYDVSTAIRSGEFAPSLGGLTGIAFNNSGTKVFLLSESTDKVHEYNLTTAFVVTSGVSFAQEKSVVSGDNCPTDLQFNNDGSKMYILGCRGDRVDEYDLSTPYDISTAGSSPNRTQNTNVSDSNPRAVVFSADGSKMFTIGLQNKSVREFSLSTPFNVTTSSSNGTHDLTSVDGQIRGMAFNGNGTKIYFAGQSNDKVYEYDLVVAYDLFNVNSVTYAWDSGVTDGIAFTPTTTATYTVTGTDANGCTATVDVTVNALPTVDAGTDQTVCSGTAVTLTASGASTYSWDNNVTDGTAFTPSATTTYSVTGTDVTNVQLLIK